MNENMKKSSRRTAPVLWVLLALVLLGMSVGGAAAYLSHSGGSVANTFEVAEHPTIEVNGNNEVVVADPGYAVYLRAAVVVNWKSETGENLLATVPAADEYTLEVGENWVKQGDFYYYKLPLHTGKTSPVVITLTAKEDVEKPGYTLVADVAVQAIQAVGQTDGEDPVDAVQNAWGISGDAIEALGNQTQ